MKSVTVDRQKGRQIDIEFRVKYQYVKASKEHLQVLIKFLAEQHKQTERGEE